MLDSSHGRRCLGLSQTEKREPIHVQPNTGGKPRGHPNKRMGDRRCRLRAADRQLVIYKLGLGSRFGRSAHPPKNNPHSILFSPPVDEHALRRSVARPCWGQRPQRGAAFFPSRPNSCAGLLLVPAPLLRSCRSCEKIRSGKFCRVLKAGHSAADLAKRFGVSRTAIRNIGNGRRWSGWLIDGRRRAPKPMPCASGGGGSNITRMCLLPQKTTQTTSSPPSRKPSIWARKQGRAPLVARVRHSLQRPRLQPCHAPLIGGGPRSSSGNLAKFTANRFGRRDAAICRELGEKRKRADCA